MKKQIDIPVREPQYCVITDLSFAQVDHWFGHTRKDLKMDIIYPEDNGKKYPCIIWICGGGWLSLDKSAHLAYLSGLAREGFVVASVQYRTTNHAKFPAQLQDVKAGIRYLRAHADRYRIDSEHFGVMGESAGGYLSAMAALADDAVFDAGDYLDFSSAVQAACPWYPPSDITKFPNRTPLQCAGSPESMLLGKNVAENMEEAEKICPVHFVKKGAPPFLIIHGVNDHTVPFSQGELLHDELEKAGCDVTLLSIRDADHADIRFFQKEVWEEIANFFKRTLK